MRAPTDLPRRRARGPRGRIGLIIAAAIVIVLLVSLRGIAGFYTDYLWFRELHLTPVWRSVLGAKIALAVLFTVLFFVIMWVNLFIADRIAPPFRPAGPEEELVERFHEIVGTRAGLLRTAVSAVFALIAGPGTQSQWQNWILLRNHVSFGVSDPQFHKDAGYFIFQLPFYKFLITWFFAAFVIVLIVTAVAHYLNGGIRIQTPGQRVTPQVKAHLSVLLGILALVKAAGYYLQKYELAFSNRGVVRGATYTDVHAELPALKLLLLISLFAALLFLWNIRQRGWFLPVIAVGLWAFVSVIVGAAYPAFVQQFRVQPTESKRERPYIKRNIDATRAAMNLGDTASHDFQYNEQLTGADLVANNETIRNIRLWDPKYLQTTYKREQELKTFYKINDVDVDRYQIDGRTTQTLISARELNSAGVPSPSWVNSHLVYTHGYGAVMSPANAVTTDGGPNLLVKDLPPVGTPKLSNPSVYYGEGLSGYSIVETGQKEVDYSDLSGSNHTTVYTGSGGVKMGSIVRRAAFALRFGDLNPLISGFVSPSSRIIYVRDIADRVRKAVPFLRYDNDPYPVILDGRIFWIQDAYTTTNRYPYGQTADTSRLDGGDLKNGSFDYVRNSVKVVIDAYNGSMRFFVFDPKDPLLKAYRKAFPKLFTDVGEMDRLYPGLRDHLRYPEDLFRVQTNMYGLYHMTDPAAFYNKTDQWEIAQDPGSGRPSEVANLTGTVGPNGQLIGPPREQRMDPYYLLMRLPNEQKESFLILQPFVPFSKDDSRKELTAFMIAKSDPDDYGKLESYVMPRTGQVDGPAIVNGKIQQDPTVSQTVSLLDQKGSEVLLGNLLVIPIKQSLIYFRPFYVQAAGTPVPQFKKAIVVYGDRVVMADSLKDALATIFGAAPETQEQQTATPPPVLPGGPTPAPIPGVTATVAQLLDQAQAAFNDAQKALTAGDLATYQADIKKAQDLVSQARAIAGASTPPPSSASSGASSPSTTTTTAPAASA